MTGIDTNRLRQAMEDAGMDQSALARAAGCTPGAINQIAMGNVRRSRYLPEIADTLRVSLRWLRGEDVPRDPTTPIPPRPVPTHQFVTMQVALPSEAALTRMFEGLLLTLDQTLPPAELARMLARRLPIGLAQLRDLAPESFQDGAPFHDADARPSAKGRPSSRR